MTHTEKRTRRVRRTAALLAAVLMAAAALTLTSCSGTGEVPKGYQYATAEGEYFRLFVPTQWQANTAAGVSGAILSLNSQTSVTMAEIPFDPQLTDENGDVRTASLDDFAAAHLAELETMTNFKIENKQDSHLGSGRAVDVTYIATVSGTLYRFRQILSKVGGRFYLFTYSALADEFGTYADEVDEIIQNILFYTTPYEPEGKKAKKIPNDKNTPEGMKLVSTNEVAYRFYVPEAWTLDESNAANLVYIKEADGTRSNVSMTAYMPDDDGFSVQDYRDLCFPQYESALPGFTLLSETEGMMGDRKASVWVYTYTLGGVTYITRQTACVYTTMIYTMTYTAVADTEDSPNYASHLDDVARMQENVRFRAPFKS